jgi:hypothetical protein
MTQRIAGSKCELAYALGVSIIDKVSAKVEDEDEPSLTEDLIENLIDLILKGRPPIDMTFIRRRVSDVEHRRQSLRDLYFDL